MKTLLLGSLALLMTGCVTSNSRGVCIGLFDDKKPGVDYELSIRNVALGFIFSETIIVPVVVAAKDFECPVEP